MERINIDNASYSNFPRVGTLIAEAVSPLVTAPHSSMKLKWPNDVLIDGKKVGYARMYIATFFLMEYIGNRYLGLWNIN
jgi:hypothetical protein